MIHKLSIIIPAYNEEKTISLILDKVISVKLTNNIQKEIIVVNDCSKDGTKKALEDYCNNHKEYNIRALHHEINQGKGAALHTGIKHATGEFLIIQDADDEYDPREYNDLLKPVLEGHADVVYGSRFMGGNPHRILFFWHSLGNKLLTALSNMFTNLNLSDMETCYKLFKTDIIQSIELKENRFGFEPEITAKIARVPNIRIYEVGISYYGRTYADGKKIGWKDGFRAIFSILKYNVFDKSSVKNVEQIKNQKSSKIWMFFLFLSVFVSFSYLSVYNNRKFENTWQSEFKSDKAGYYIYLPATFIYGFSVKNYPPNFGKQCGDGFGFNKEGKLFTKYSSGVALLILPFFIALHFLLLLFGYDASGFSHPYHVLVNITAAFYLAIGIIALFKFLRNYLNKNISIFTIIILIFSTNLYYYSAFETLMSHVYSFSVFSVFLYALKKYLDFGNKTKYLLLIAISVAFAILIRLTNIYILIFILLLDIKSFDSFKERIIHFVIPKRLLIFALCFILVFLPQLIYWKYYSGHFFYNGYENEGFEFWKNPKFSEVLFSPLNGLFLYNPSYLIILVGIIIASFKYKLNGFLGLLSFIFIAYISASWHCTHFGCSYGMRTFVEFNALFALSFGYFLNYIFLKRNLVIKLIISLLLIYSTYFSINLENHYDRCFFGTQWDWESYRRYFDKAEILFLERTEFEWFNDFESEDKEFSNSKVGTKLFDYSTSGKKVAYLDTTIQYSSGFHAMISQLSPRPINKVQVSLNALLPEKPKEMLLVCCITHGNDCVYWEKYPLDNLFSKNNQWINISNTFNIPEIDIYSMLDIYVWSQTKDSIIIDDMSVKVLY